jgi:hypothetical protein
VLGLFLFLSIRLGRWALFVWAETRQLHYLWVVALGLFNLVFALVCFGYHRNFFGHQDSMLAALSWLSTTRISLSDNGWRLASVMCGTEGNSCGAALFYGE